MTMQNEHAGKKHKKGARPVIVPKQISDWIKETSTNPNVNNWKVGGGRDSWNSTGKH